MPYRPSATIHTISPHSADLFDDPRLIDGFQLIVKGKAVLGPNWMRWPVFIPPGLAVVLPARIGQTYGSLEKPLLRTLCPTIWIPERAA